MEENKEALLILAKQFSEWFNKKIRKAEFDRTLFGTVTAILDSGYQVNIAGQNHKVKGNGLSIPLYTNVRVKLPCNRWSDAYIESIVQ